MATSDTVRGVPELLRALEQIEPKIRNELVANAIRQGAEIYQEAARAEAPKQKYAGYWADVQVKRGKNKGRAKRVFVSPGALSRSIKTSAKKNAPQGPYIDIRPRSFYARFVERGTQAHSIRAKNAGVLVLGVRLFNSVDHPGIPANPFMRRTWNSKTDQVTEVITRQLRNAILYGPWSRAR